MMKKRDIGLAAEEAAARHLKKLGYKIIERNFFSRFGEIDIIARDGEYTVFVEVRYRKSESYGSGAETVDAIKRGKIKKTAEVYLMKNGGFFSPARFDVVSISGELGKNCAVEVIKDAFR